MGQAEFKHFLTNVRYLSANTASHYNRSMVVIGNMLKNLTHGKTNSVYEIRSTVEFEKTRKMLLKDPVFSMENNRHHHDYSAALRKYGEFLASFPPQHLPSIVQAPTPAPVKEEAEPINDEKQNVDDFSGWLRQQDAYASSAEKIPDAVNQISDFLFQTKAISKPITKMTSKDEVAPTLDILSSYTFAINAYLGYLKDNTPPQYQIHQMLSLWISAIRLSLKEQNLRITNLRVTKQNL